MRLMLLVGIWGAGNLARVGLRCWLRAQGSRQWRTTWGGVATARRRAEYDTAWETGRRRDGQIGGVLRASSFLGTVWFGSVWLVSVRCGTSVFFWGTTTAFGTALLFVLFFFCLFFAGLDGTDERTNERVGGRQDRPRGVFGFGYMWTNGISSQGIVYSVCATTTTGSHSQGGLYTKPGRI